LCWWFVVGGQVGGSRDGCMDGLNFPLDGWVGGWVGGWVVGHMDERIVSLIYSWMGEVWLDRRVNGWVQR
jgi:hypothetical protein